MKITDYKDVCSLPAAEKIHKLCGIYSRRYANRLALKGLDGEDLEEEIVLKIIEDKKKYTDSALVRNARRDIFDIIKLDKKDDFWNQPFEDEDDCPDTGR